MKKIAVINKNHACDNTNSVVLQMRLLRQFYTFFFRKRSCTRKKHKSTKGTQGTEDKKGTKSTKKHQQALKA